jgi:hypothetical protein
VLHRGVEDVRVEVAHLIGAVHLSARGSHLFGDVGANRIEDDLREAGDGVRAMDVRAFDDHEVGRAGKFDLHVGVRQVHAVAVRVERAAEVQERARERGARRDAELGDDDLGDLERAVGSIVAVFVDGQRGPGREKRQASGESFSADDTIRVTGTLAERKSAALDQRSQRNCDDCGSRAHGSAPEEAYDSAGIPTSFRREAGWDSSVVESKDESFCVGFRSPL